MIYTNLKVFVAWSFLGSYSPSPLKQNVSIKKFGQINALVFHHFLDIMINLRETTSRFKLQKSPLWQSSVTRLWTFNRGQTQWTLGGFCKRWCWSRDRSGDWLLAPILALSLISDGFRALQVWNSQSCDGEFQKWIWRIEVHLLVVSDQLWNLPSVSI